jgi:predicted dehydrogenase
MRILIIGLGAVGQRHARNLRLLLGDQVELLAFRQRGGGPALSDTLAVQPGVSPEDALGMAVYHDLDEALAQEPDGVVVANPSSMHLTSARRAAEAGCAVFIEKPLSHTWEGVPEFVADAARRRLPIVVGYQWRFHPLFARLQELLAERAIGRLIAVNAAYGEYMPGWHPYEDYRQSYAARRELGGGVLLTQAHDIDYLGWLIGWPQEVFSVGGHLSQLDIDVEDTASTLWRCSADGHDIPVHLHQDYVQRPPVRTCQFLGDAGKITCDLLTFRLQAWDGDGRCVVDADRGSFQRNDMFVAEMAHFLACVEGRESPQVPVTEGARSLAVALAALRSLSSGRVEPVVYADEPAPITAPPLRATSRRGEAHV